MTLKPGEEIGEEVHGMDQFIRFEEGEGTVVLDGEKHAVSDGFAVVIPAGTRQQRPPKRGHPTHSRQDPIEFLRFLPHTDIFGRFLSDLPLSGKNCRNSKAGLRDA